MMRRDFFRLARLDRRLFALYLDAVMAEAGPDFCAMDAWDGPGGFKARLVPLVGHGRGGGGPAELATAEAYEAAYAAILAALPRCRGDCRCGESRSAEAIGAREDTR